MTYDQWPSLAQCGGVGRSLVETYSFFRDDEGDGDVSENAICEPKLGHIHCPILTPVTMYIDIYYIHVHVFKILI